MPVENARARGQVRLSGQKNGQKPQSLTCHYFVPLKIRPLEAARVRDFMAFSFEHHGFSRFPLEMRSEKRDKIEIIASRSKSRFNRSRNEHPPVERRRAARLTTELKRMCGIHGERMNMKWRKTCGCVQHCSYYTS